MPFWCYINMLLFGKKEATWPSESPQSNMVIKSLDSWRQSICPLRFQSPAVKGTNKWAQKWHEGTNSWSGSWESSVAETWPDRVATLVPQTNLPETPSYTEGETLKAKSEGIREDHIGWFRKEGLLFLPGNLNGSWLTPYMPPLI